MLELKSFSCGYGAFQAVHELSLSLRPGTITGLLGPNGAGKSSTLMCVAGHVARQAGQVLFDGQDISELPATERVRRGIAISPEGRRLFKDLSVEDNLRVGGVIHPASVFKQDRDRVLSLFPRLGERLTSLAGNLSGGEQQMLAIARALMTNPKVMLVDEPSLGLAPKVVDEVYDRLCQLQALRGLTLVIVEQSSARAARVGGRMLLMRGGKIVADGDATDFAAKDLLTEAYFGGAA